ncbi:G-type lectin S-receptor-like serine/threonine-protein kinase At4g27290 [Alnus glutinosa]|uniref:G-type lectin S-receptor-like serine/threonine-protein kinase At4g27290 n=1 Tax=Alnus glutinosa TaxID=3517 RepID=UPI002D7680DE|nr:G-type lectin S-receptor-like serine/threonine-protein kinase At4g27290 [Alnus glutinosa]
MATKEERIQKLEANMQELKAIVKKLVTSHQDYAISIKELERSLHEFIENLSKTNGETSRNNSMHIPSPKSTQFLKSDVPPAFATPSPYHAHPNCDPRHKLVHCIAQRFRWMDRTQSWELFSTFQADRCDNYALCGTYATCNIYHSPVCACLEGFLPKSPKDWDSTDWCDGCVRRTPLECNNGDDFLKRTGLKLPDTSSSWFNKTLTLKECEELCLKNCSCTAYSSLDVKGGGSGCLLWFASLVDIIVFTEGGQDLYIRMAASELDHLEKKRHSSKKKLIAFIVGSAFLVVGMTIVALVSFIWKKKLRNQEMTKRNQRKDCDNGGGENDMELPIFDLAAVANATDNFSNNNKLGEGGFGPVYKGILPDGRYIAVKRLSKNSGQGLNEFKNEVILIAKLQHRNLVKILGYCIQENENMLVYEYMPNKSLDSFIFGLNLDLDLKASNILLDNNMNPKISNFGLARSFGGDQIDSKTNRIIGTHGYMSPEYAVHGRYSIKSDVFSFGVLVLETMSGKKNREFCHPDHDLNLLGHAWKLWIEDRPMELIDELEGDLCTLCNVLRHIHVGLLCVQQKPEDRPNMSSVVQMLTNESLLPRPRQPGFFTDPLEAVPSSSKQATCSVNRITITLLEAR